MDISKVVLEDTTVISDFYDPHGNLLKDEKTGEPVTIEIYSTESNRFQTVVANNIREDQKARKDKADEDDDAPITDEEISKNRERSLRTIAQCTKSWSGFYNKGKALACNEQNAILVYSKLPFIAKRLNRKMADDKAFFKMASED